MKMKNGAVILCCGGKGCPELKIQDNHVIIKDDDGKVVKMTKAQAALIPEAIKKLTK